MRYDKIDDAKTNTYENTTFVRRKRKVVACRLLDIAVYAMFALILIVVATTFILNYSDATVADLVDRVVGVFAN